MATFNVQAALSAGATPEQIMAHLAKRKAEGVSLTLQGADTPVKKDRGLAGLLPLIGSVGGGLLGSTVAPVAGTVAGSAAGGGLGELLAQYLSGEKTDLGKIGNEALWSGAGSLAGVGIGKILGGAGSGLLEDTARGTIAKNLPKGTAVGKIDELVAEATAKGAPTGSYVAKARKFQEIANAAKTARGNIAGGVEDLIPRSKLIDSLKSSAMETGLLDTKEAPKLNMFLNRIAKGDNVKTKDILTWLEGLSKPATPTYGSANPTAVARAARALKDTGNEVLNQYLPEGATKELTTKIGRSIPLTEAYTNAAREGTKIPFLGTSIPLGPLNRPAQAAADYGARIGSTAGNSKLLQQLLGQAGTRTMMPRGGDTIDTSSAIDGQIVGETTQPDNKQNISDLLQKVALLDLMQGGKNTTKLIALSKFISPPVSATQQGQISQIQAATGLVDQLENAYNQASANGQAGFAVGPLAGILGNVSGGAINKDAALYNSLRQGFTALIARATGEKGVLTDADAARTLQLIPSLNDNPDLAQSKLEQIRQVFQNAQQRLNANLVDNSNDIMSLFGASQ